MGKIESEILTFFLNTTIIVASVLQDITGETTVSSYVFVTTLFFSFAFKFDEHRINLDKYTFVFWAFFLAASEFLKENIGVFLFDVFFYLTFSLLLFFSFIYAFFKKNKQHNCK